MSTALAGLKTFVSEKNFVDFPSAKKILTEVKSAFLEMDLSVMSKKH